MSGLELEGLARTYWPALVAVLVLLAIGIVALRRPRKQALPQVAPKAAAPLDAEIEMRLEADELRRTAAARVAATEPAERARNKAEIEELRRRAYQRERAAEEVAKERKRSEREEVEARARSAAAAIEEAARAMVAAEAGGTLRAGMERTRASGFVARLATLLGTKPTADETLFARLEEILLSADIGVATASRLVREARGAQGGDLLANIKAEVERILAIPTKPSLEGGGPPHVVMIVGVNGTGKTTTVGKLAARARAQGQRVLLGAGDTFRAAAAEQLDIWASRAGVEIVSGASGTDSASVLFEAVKRGRAESYDLVIADTAGRLHTKVGLMEELKKVRRVIDKALPGAPHEVLLVLDATTGQNALAQARQFQEAVEVTGIVLTKLDGTAKGGAIIGMCDVLKLPVRWVGVGEKAADLRPFDAHEYVEALFAA